MERLVSFWLPLMTMAFTVSVGVEVWEAYMYYDHKRKKQQQLNDDGDDQPHIVIIKKTLSE
jgi:hypothetical protein